MLVVKRDGRRESVKFDKITARIEKLCYGLNADYVKPVEIAKKVIDGLYDGVSTIELDNLAAETAATMTTRHPDFAKLAARISISNLHKVTETSFSNTMKRMYEYINPKTKIIFTTAYAEHAVKSYELDAIDFLVKPFSLPRFMKAINKAEKLIDLSETEYNEHR